MEWQILMQLLMSIALQCPHAVLATVVLRKRRSASIYVS